MKNDGTHCIRVLELFSGIGGMHYALSKARDTLSPQIFDFEVVAAIDISDVANKVYQHNFPQVHHIAGNICGLTAEKINKWEIDAIFMSPPCQPFTRQGLQKDLNDSRTEPLVHIVNLLPKLRRLKYILVENVKGFENSDTCKLLTKALHKLSFETKTFLVSPTQIGIPNSRLRFYLLAKKTNHPGQNIFEEIDPAMNVITDLTGLVNISPIIKDAFLQNTNPCALEDYLKCNANNDSLLIPDKVLCKYGEILDIVKPTSTNSCCFTKSYGRYAEGTGSVIQQDGNLDSVYERAKMYDKKSDDYVKILQELKLRYIEPYEVADILGFPVKNSAYNAQVGEIHFQFPPEYLERRLHCYRVLGNSLNVNVVCFLSCILFTWNNNN